jgi:hypothetical protein
MNMFKNPEIGFWGGQALLVSSITGPALTTGMHLESHLAYISSAYISAGRLAFVRSQFAV